MAEALLVNKDTRSVKVPYGFVLGVESDEQTNKVTIKVPQFVGNDGDIDLSLFSLRIIYTNANGIKGTHSIADVKAWTEQDDKNYPDVKGEGHFLKVVWPLSRLVTAARGNTYFTLCAFAKNVDGAFTNEWNTEVCGLPVRQGLEINDSDMTQEAESVINQMLAQMAASASDADRAAKESAASADASAKSAAAAADSEENALNYKISAESSKNSAAGSATSAQNYASQAATAKTGAETAKTAASAFADAAKASADTAAGYAGAATYSGGVDAEGYISLFHYKEG